MALVRKRFIDPKLLKYLWWVEFVAKFACSFLSSAEEKDKENEKEEGEGEKTEEELPLFLYR